MPPGPKVSVRRHVAAVLLAGAWLAATPFAASAASLPHAPAFGGGTRPVLPRVLTVPEPASYALAAGAAALAVSFWLRRRPRT